MNTVQSVLQQEKNDLKSWTKPTRLACV